MPTLSAAAAALPQFSDQAGSDVFQPNVYEYNSALERLRQDGTYRLICDLPNPDNTWTLEVRWQWQRRSAQQFVALCVRMMSLQMLIPQQPAIVLLFHPTARRDVVCLLSAACCALRCLLLLTLPPVGCQRWHGRGWQPECVAAL